MNNLVYLFTGGVVLVIQNQIMMRIGALKSKQMKDEKKVFMIKLLKVMMS